MPTDDYELVPHEELDRIQHDLSRLKKDAKSRKEDPHLLIKVHNSVERLHSAITKLMILFGKAQEEIASEPDSLTRLARLQAQNEKIASGMVSIIQMMHDQQTQLNQLSELFGSMHDSFLNQAKKEDYFMRHQMAKSKSQPQQVVHSSPPPQQNVQTHHTPEPQPVHQEKHEPFNLEFDFDKPQPKSHNPLNHLQPPNPHVAQPSTGFKPLPKKSRPLPPPPRPKHPGGLR